MALERYPNDPKLLAQRGVALTAQGHLEAAIDDLGTATRYSGDEAFIHSALGDALEQAGRMESARDAYTRALALEPDRAAAHNNLGAVVLSMGEIDTARGCFERAVELDPGLALAWKNLSSIHDPGSADTTLVERLRACIDKPGVAASDLAYLHFALAKLLDDTGHYDRAFTHYVTANALGGKCAEYDHQSHTRTVDRIIGQFSKDRVTRGLSGASPSQAPIFIIGMPRCGSTLVEQILSSHPLVGGAGEFSFFDAVRFGLQPDGSGYHYAAYLERLEKHDVTALAQRYLVRLHRDAPDARHVTDKLLSNYLHLGIIAMTFPRARFIHCRRDAQDTCLSIFFRELPNVAFSWDLFDIGRHYREYERLMSHWGDVMGERVYTVRYESLVGDLESHARSLVEHCGLAWDERCLEFYTSKRAVATSSVWQVRQPIYRHAIGRWKRYAVHLDPLRAGLRGVAKCPPT
jgi:tetratricopeptide (TPR) repeat protein